MRKLVKSKVKVYVEGVRKKRRELKPLIADRTSFLHWLESRWHSVDIKPVVKIAIFIATGLLLHYPMLAFEPAVKHYHG